MSNRFSYGALRSAAALAVVAAVLAACSQAAATPAASQPASQPPVTAAPSATQAPVTLTMTIWGNDTDKKVYSDRIALVEKKYPWITVNLTQISDQYDTKLQTQVAGGKAPDLMEMAEAINVYSSKGQLEDLAPYYKAAGVDPVKLFGQGAVNTYTTDGHLWASPDRSGAAVMFYNKDMFDKAGVKYPTADWTWDDFRADAKALTVSSGTKVTQWGYGAGDWWPWYMNWIKQGGGDVIDASGNPVINSDANVASIKFYNDMVFTDKSALSPRDYANLSLPNGSPDPLFAQGKLAMEVTGFWNVGSLAKTTLNWDIQVVPQGKQKATAAFGSGIAVSSTSAHKDAAALVAIYFGTVEGQGPIVTSGLDVPANVEAASSDAFLNPTWLKQKVNLKAFGDSAAFVYSPPLVPQWNQIQKAFTDGLAKVWSDNASVSEGLGKVQTTVKTLLGK